MHIKNFGITVSGIDQFNLDGLPKWIINDNIEDISIFVVSETVVRLQNFELITLMYDRTAGRSDLH